MEIPGEVTPYRTPLSSDRNPQRSVSPPDASPARSGDGLSDDGGTPPRPEETQARRWLGGEQRLLEGQVPRERSRERSRERKIPERQALPPASNIEDYPEYFREPSRERRMPERPGRPPPVFGNEGTTMDPHGPSRERRMPEHHRRPPEIYIHNAGRPEYSHERSRERPIPINTRIPYRHRRSPVFYEDDFLERPREHLRERRMAAGPGYPPMHVEHNTPAYLSISRPVSEDESILTPHSTAFDVYSNTGYASDRHLSRNNKRASADTINPRHPTAQTITTEQHIPRPFQHNPPAYPEQWPPDPYVSKQQARKAEGMNDNSHYPWGYHRYPPPAELQYIPTPYDHNSHAHQPPQYIQQGPPQHSSQHHPRYDEEKLDESLSEDDMDWMDADLTNSPLSSVPDVLQSYNGSSQPYLPCSNADADDDLLNPSDWTHKLQAIEQTVRQNHSQRGSWPTTWRHSDIKTCPKVLESAWADILNVNHQISQLHLDEIMPTFESSKYLLKRKGALAEVVAAYKTRSSPEVETIRPTVPKVSASMLDTVYWDDTCRQVQRLLKARDYLVAVCCDAEYLGKIHPALDVITWFEQAESIGPFGARRVRSQVIELMSVSLTHVAAIIQSLNEILQALLWGWSDESPICIDPAKITRSEDPIVRSHEKQLFKTSYLKIIRSKVYENGENRIQACIQTLWVGLEVLIDEIEVFAAILSQALWNQCDVHITSERFLDIKVSYGRVNVFGLSFTPRSLTCMGSLIQGRSVWVLTQCWDPSLEDFDFHSFVSPTRRMSYESAPSLNALHVDIRTKIEDLARIWGPVWTFSELENERAWVWYQLSGGYIGASPEKTSHINVEPDESPCHFSTIASSFGTFPFANFFVPDRAYLLIGHGLPATLVEQELCQIPLETGLAGLTLQPIGTLRPFKYKDSTTMNVSVGYSGAQASWSTQFKTNPGILAKESILLRWKLEPRFRNPRLLLLWYGVKVSLCTNNARRCRIIDLLRSRAIIQYLSTIYRPEIDSDSTDYKKNLFDALGSSNPNTFIELYDSHPEWQAELGGVVARCLDILSESGVNKSGNLAVFTFIERFHDPEQLAILSKKHHTWIGLLEDSADTATFALMSQQCLGYPVAPGGMCRQKDELTNEVKTVLETGYTATQRSNLVEQFTNLRAHDRLRIQNQHKFRIKQRSSRGILLGTWENGPLEYLRLPRSSPGQYRERR